MLKYYSAMQTWLATRKKSEKGQSLAEYGLILALVAVFCIGALTVLGENLDKMLSGLADTIGSQNTGG